MAHALFEQVSSCRFVHWVQLEPGQQPEDFPPEYLAEWLHW
jgi:hypothetical protein